MLLADAADSLGWALSHAGSVVWLIAIVGGIVSWAARRQRAMLARQTALGRPAMQPPGSSAAPVAPAPPSVAPSPAQPRAVYQRAAPPRTGAPAADPAPAALSSPVLRGAFGDPAHARTAVILAEILAPPVALR